MSLIKIIKTIGKWTILGGTILAVGYCGYSLINRNMMDIPTDRKMDGGYVNVRTLNIKVEDLDKDGKNEVILEHNYKSYLFMLDKNNNPVAREYSVIPSQKPRIIIKE